MSHERLFTIGELAKKCGVTVRTLQFYDRRGLLTPSRYSDGGRRLYGVDDVLRLQQILFYKGFGFSLDEIRNRLMLIHSAQDFAEMLLRQKSIVEKQIDYLKKTVALMDKTVNNIRENEDIPINIVIAILAATKLDNFFGFVMKSVEGEKLEALMSAAKSYDNKEVEDGWTVLLLRLKELHQCGADPRGSKGARLAKDWWDQVMNLTGGDPNLVSTILKAGEDMSSWSEEADDVKMAIEHFLSPALSDYFIKKGIVPPCMEEKQNDNSV